MAEFNGAGVVAVAAPTSPVEFVPVPTSPEMVLWALPGPSGDIPYAEVENLVDAEFNSRIATMSQLELDTEAHASAAAGSASVAASSATSASGSATAAQTARTGAETARTQAQTARTGAETARTGAETARDVAQGHAGRAEAAANEFDLTATSTTGAPGSSASVTVTGDGPAYELSLTIPRGDKGDKGDEGDVSQAKLDAAVASLVNNAPEALNTLNELSTALGGDPNFATTVSTQIGERAKTSDVNAALAGKADVGAEDTAKWGQVSDKPSTFTPTAHTHPVTDLTATGTLSSSTYLRGDGTWATPPNSNTTYAVPAQAEIEAGTATTARAISAATLKGAIQRWATGTYTTAISTIGQALNRSATAADARTAIGAAADNHTHTTAQVTGLDSALGGKVTASGATTTLWSGSQSAYDALPAATRNAVGFVAVIV